jgi:hypothetical protein
MARIVDQDHLDKDHPIFTGRFIFTSHLKSQPKKEPVSSEQKSKEKDQ